jgi:hypothetical protein
MTLSLPQLKRLKQGDLISIEMGEAGFHVRDVKAMVLEHVPVTDFLTHSEKLGLKLLVLTSDRIAFLSYDVLRWTFPTTLISTI